MSHTYGGQTEGFMALVPSWRTGKRKYTHSNILHWNKKKKSGDKNRKGWYDTGWHCATVSYHAVMLFVGKKIQLLYYYFITIISTFEKTWHFKIRKELDRYPTWCQKVKLQSCCFPFLTYTVFNFSQRDHLVAFNDLYCFLKARHNLAALKNRPRQAKLQFTLDPPIPLPPKLHTSGTHISPLHHTQPTHPHTTISSKENLCNAWKQ